MAYFDNASTTYPKPECIYAFMDEFYRKSGGSVGRGNYQIAQSANMLIDDTRIRIKELLHCPVKKVIFTPSATISLNMIIQGCIEDGAKNIYISPFEHNAVTRTLYHYETLGKVKVYELAVTKELIYDIQRIRYQFEEVTPDIVIVNHASNVIGLIAPIDQICKLAKNFNATTLLDMAQTAGLIDSNIGLDIFDFAVFAGHKTLFGPTGISGFVMKSDLKLSPVIFGGTGYDSSNQNMPQSIPERYEVGTCNISGIAGLNAALRWIEEKTIKQIRIEEVQNRKKLITLFEKYDFISVVGNVKGVDYVGIVSCLLDGMSSESAGNIFSSRGICVRTGLHCAPRAHRFMNTYPSGTIRFSVNALTSNKDFEELEEALDYICKEL